MATRIGGGEFITVTDHPPSSFSTEGRESELPFSVFFFARGEGNHRYKLCRCDVRKYKKKRY